MRTMASPRAPRSQFHLPAAGRDVGAVRQRHLAILGFFDADRALGGQAGRQRLGEHRRHVLDDEYRRAQVGGQRRHQLGQRAGPSGGDTDQYHGRARRRRSSRATGRLRRAPGAGGTRKAARWPARGPGTRMLPDFAAPLEGADHRQKLPAERVEIRPRRAPFGLGQEIEGPQLQGPHGHFSALDRVGTQHDDTGFQPRRTASPPALRCRSSPASRYPGSPGRAAAPPCGPSPACRWPPCPLPPLRARLPKPWKRSPEQDCVVHHQDSCTHGFSKPLSRIAASRSMGTLRQHLGRIQAARSRDRRSGTLP